MRAYVEVRGGSAPELFPLDVARTTVGRAPRNRVQLANDAVRRRAVTVADVRSPSSG